MPLHGRPDRRRAPGPVEGTSCSRRSSHRSPGLWDREPLAPKIHDVAAGSFLRREPPHIRGTGYVVHSLEAALWAFAKSTSFEHGALLAVNLGDDADTTGAVYGQIAGAFYGADAIPGRWRSRLARLETLESFAERLMNAQA